MEFSHVSVLAEECIQALNLRPDGVYVDGTTGGGGHSLRIAQQLGPAGRLICIDRDEEALAAASRRLEAYRDRVTFVKSNFAQIAQVIEGQGLAGVDGILFDLGVSSYQLDNGDRGFSYMHDAPLDMRMDRSQPFSAWDVVNTYTQEQLRQILWEYGEERYSGRVAAAIVQQREESPIETTGQLAQVIREAMPAAARREKQHPAKRSFQAIRIEVNGELRAVEQAMEGSVDKLLPGGRLAVISFHSLEDRIVKKIFAQQAKGCTCPPEFPVCVCGKKPRLKLISRGVITAGQKELDENPRARSAKLRVAERI
ncbi:MAG TPA: 16S rRNA (cytosine(1402)-N(4))-methyltransferase RsmH [Firmicutes bacterium]|nr:16S rRNA (cytosine(1402)-N(4))-methyltransferase RsmH [Bacillota bacterium]